MSDGCHPRARMLRPQDCWEPEARGGSGVEAAESFPCQAFPSLPCVALGVLQECQLPTSACRGRVEGCRLWDWSLMLLEEEGRLWKSQQVASSRGSAKGRVSSQQWWSWPLLPAR